ncbi:Domain of unknown function DUF305 [Paracoccaceae bacterium]|jgi:uncharacterized protein (DUF305 family)
MPRLILLIPAGLALALAAALPNFAEEAIDHSAHMVEGDQGPSSLAFMAATDKMHQDMAILLTGNADVDFIRGMIPHHQGAVDTARIVLEHGSDPEVRKFAESVIAAQEAEIAWMKSWLEANGG